MGTGAQTGKKRCYHVRPSADAERRLREALLIAGPAGMTLAALAAATGLARTTVKNYTFVMSGVHRGGGGGARPMRVWDAAFRADAADYVDHDFGRARRVGELVAYVASCGAAGASKAEICAAMHAGLASVERYLIGLVPTRLAAHDSYHGSRVRLRRYYAPGLAPSAKPKTTPKPKPPVARTLTTTIREMQKTVERDEPVIVPPNVKRTTMKNYVGDTRYMVTDAPRAIDARECRPWARAVAAARAA